MSTATSTTFTSRKSPRINSRQPDLSARCGLIAIALGISMGCATRSGLVAPAPSASDYIAAVRAEKKPWIHPDKIPELEAMCLGFESNFPLRIGMSRAEVEQAVAREMAAAEFDTSRFALKPLTNSPPGSLSFMAGYPHWFWVDVGMKNDTVQNIYIIAGSADHFVPPGFRLSGEGSHVGAWADALKKSAAGALHKNP